jgi:hypothetical protein
VEPKGAYVPGPDEGWADFVARCFHSEYERIAPQFGYATRPDSAVTWENVPETNKRLMRSTVAALVQRGVIELGDAWEPTSQKGEQSFTEAEGLHLNPSLDMP